MRRKTWRVNPPPHIVELFDRLMVAQKSAADALGFDFIADPSYGYLHKAIVSALDNALMGMTGEISGQMVTENGKLRFELSSTT